MMFFTQSFELIYTNRRLIMFSDIFCRFRELSKTKCHQHKLLKVIRFNNLKHLFYICVYSKERRLIRVWIWNFWGIATLRSCSDRRVYYNFLFTRVHAYPFGIGEAVGCLSDHLPKSANFEISNLTDLEARNRLILQRKIAQGSWWDGQIFDSEQASNVEAGRVCPTERQKPV